MIKIPSKNTVRNTSITGTFHLIPSTKLTAIMGLNAYILVINGQAFESHGPRPEPEQRFEKAVIKATHDSSWAARADLFRTHVLVGFQVGEHNAFRLYLTLEDADVLLNHTRTAP